MFEPLSSVYQVNQVSSGSLSVLFSRHESIPSVGSDLKLSPLRKTLSSPPYPVKQESSISGTLASLKRSFSSAFAKGSDNGSPSPSKVNKQKKLDGFFLKDSENHSATEDSNTSYEYVLNNTEQNTIAERESKRLSSEAQLNNIGDAKTPTYKNDNRSKYMPMVTHSSEPEENSHRTREKTGCEEKYDSRQYINDKVSSEENETASACDSNPVLCHSVEPHCDNNSNIPKFTLESRQTLNCEKEKSTSGTSGGDTCLTLTEYDESQLDIKRKSVKVLFSVLRLEERLKRRIKCADKIKERTNRFHAKISPTDNQAAENELRKSKVI